MKLFVDTSDYRTEVEPKFNGTAAQHYAACIEKASECLNNTLHGLEQATTTFVDQMQKHPATAELVKYTFAIAPVLAAGSDKELREGLANFVVRTEQEPNHEISVGALLYGINKGTTHFAKAAEEPAMPESLSTPLVVQAG